MTSPKDVPATGKSSAQSPPAKEVDLFHKYDDLDSSNSAHHHTIGPKGAARFKHFHDGEDSPKLLEGTIFTGIVGTYNATTFRQILDALERLGASDTTS
jgi:hypothetical protein